MAIKPNQPQKRPLIQFRKPRKEDGANIWKLIKDTGNLDLNSAYCYLMLCELFPNTCVVAEQDRKIVGFLSAFQQPDAMDVIFVWQVAVDQSQRGKGLGTALIKELLQRKACVGIRYVEATVSPSNGASQSLFKRLARSLETECQVTECFSSVHFPVTGHEDELTYRIGPFQAQKSKQGVI